MVTLITAIITSNYLQSSKTKNYILAYTMNSANPFPDTKTIIMKGRHIHHYMAANSSTSSML